MIDWNIILILIVIFAVGLFSGTLWLFFKGISIIIRIIAFLILGVIRFLSWIFIRD